MIGRIKQVMISKQLSPAQLAERLDINRSNLTHLFSGRNQASLDLAKKILNAFPEINTEWLIMGVGAMQKTDFEDYKQAKLTNTDEELDLFSSLQEIENPQLDTPKEEPKSELKVAVQQKKNISPSTPRELNSPPIDTNRSEKIDSHEIKKVEKIIFFYNDKTFEAYYP